MKAWFSHCQLYGCCDDSNLKFGVGWYRHYKDYPWFGFTIEFYLYRWLVQFHFVDNWKEYNNHLNKRNERWVNYKKRLDSMNRDKAQK